MIITTMNVVGEDSMRFCTAEISLKNAIAVTINRVHAMSALSRNIFSFAKN